MSKVLLEITDLAVNYGATRVLYNISFSVSAEQIITIIGPNGSGKTTLAKTILGILPASQGSLYKAKDLRLGYIPQKLMVDKLMPITARRFLTLQAMRYPSTEIQKAVDLLKLSDSLLSKQISELSGGQLQRVMFARSLLTKPELLVLDEPLQGVDISGQIEFYEIMEQLRNQHKLSILMISHDLFTVMKKTDHVICLNHHICCQGSPEYISAHQDYHNLFGTNLATYSHHHDHAH